MANKHGPGITADGKVSADPKDWPSSNDIEDYFKCSSMYGKLLDPAYVRAFWEHDQYWVTVIDMDRRVGDEDCSKTFSVVAATPGMEIAPGEFVEIAFEEV